MPITPSLNSNCPASFSMQSGGKAGMAGVGRRAFTAAARVALFASSSTRSTYQGDVPSGLDIPSPATSPPSPGDEDHRSRSNSTSTHSPRSHTNSNATHSLANLLAICL
ncbi:hypothetical protein FISHEDRAFT_72223 [Fistulina hepatica ATCC 64428]|uniref:Uncharacterized protein n=1 Tax=Fistulina hepatica ATCC 64428 TaxID=1128425 RepID=A0A0D7AEV5_9AGAR|nr:hypothetical protein FISHEDRAFT_72223 [Fistulina hepatica ATCC 64428]